MSNRATLPNTLFHIAGALVAIAGGAAQAIVIVDAPAANVRVHQDCTGVTPGGTDLPFNGSVGYWPAGSLDGALDAMRWQFGSTTVHNGLNPDTTRAANRVWSFQWGNNLAGTLTVDWNKAFDTDFSSGGTNYCKHGSEFDCHYTRAATDPTHLEWVQVFTSSENWAGIASGTLINDPYPNDGTDDAPFYFNPDDNRNNFMHVNPVPGGLIFGDTPFVRHVESQPWSGWFRANLFLASWDDANPYSLTIHDGIRWGWDGACAAPAPGSLALMSLGLCAIGRRRR